jgi:hypothetical protein
VPRFRFCPLKFLQIPLYLSGLSGIQAPAQVRIFDKEIEVDQFQHIRVKQLRVSFEKLENAGIPFEPGVTCRIALRVRLNELQFLSDCAHEIVFCIASLEPVKDGEESHKESQGIGGSFYYHSAQQESFPGSLRREMAAILSASAIVG